MTLPRQIPAGARVVVRITDGIDPVDHRMKFRDYVGHVVSWDGYTLEMVRDAAANGSRPAQNVTIHQEQIATLKPRAGAAQHATPAVTQGHKEFGGERECHLRSSTAISTPSSPI